MSDALTAKGSIVFIDDEDGPIDFYGDELKAAGYAVTRFHDLAKALNYIRETPASPSLWLVDVMMPAGMDDTIMVNGQPLARATSQGLGSGRVLFSEIRKRFPVVPVILLTSVTTPRILEALEAEMDDRAICESKVFVVPSDLVRLVERMIESSNTAET